MIKIILEDSEALAVKAAERFAQLAQSAIQTQGRFSVLLAGGSTPERLHQILAESYAHTIDWSKVYVFFGDERFIPPDDPQSNYLMAVTTLLAYVPIPEENIFPFVTVDTSPEEAAELYQAELKRFFGAEPNFDLVILGIGPDGHTASLFPGHPALQVSDRWVTAVHDAPKPPPERLTLTFTALNQARVVMFLISGESKAEVSAKALQGESDPSTLPMVGVRPAGELLYLLDKAAASRLN